MKKNNKAEPVCILIPIRSDSSAVALSSLGRNENTHGYAKKTRRKTTWEW